MNLPELKEKNIIKDYSITNNNCDKYSMDRFQVVSYEELEITFNSGEKITIKPINSMGGDDIELYIS